MSEKTPEKIKYSILRFLDVTGFTVFDPLVRLAFREEPRKQVESLVKFLIIPIIFIAACTGLWWVVAPNHKTKSGEVPTPDIVISSALINDTFSNREKTKESDFLLQGEDRLESLKEVEHLMAERATELEFLEAHLAEQESIYKTRTESLISPIEAQLNALKEKNRAARTGRSSEIDTLSLQVASGERPYEALVRAIREDGELYAMGRGEESVFKDQIEAIRSDKYKPLEDARLAVNAVADEIQFLKKRQGFLSESNRSVKLEQTKEKLVAQDGKLSNAEDAKAVLREAKAFVKLEDGIGRLETQQYASAMTVYLQIKRSIFTVFVGFLMAAAIAIPIGILCGLNKIAMACLTPIISIFKPVSPVVWLLIFQIIVGAFFPDPESHPFFLFFDSIPFINTLGINPSLIFSACTVAMCAVWPALVNTALGVASIDKDHLNVARVLRLNFWDRLTKIIIPSSLPLVFTGLRISLGVEWMVLIAAEALSSSDGLGKFVWDEYQNGSSFSFANIIYACFVVGLIGFLLDRMMIVLQRFVSFDGSETAV